MKRIYLIDCPGVVYGNANDTETDIILKGVVRVENIENTEEHIPVLLSRVKTEYMRRTYGVDSWTDSMDFLSKLAVRSGKLLKGGEPDVNTISKMVLNDWVRGKIPFYTMPPGCSIPGEDSGDVTKNTEEEVSNTNTAAEEEVTICVNYFRMMLIIVSFIETTRTRSSTATYQEY
jgi:nuclear GTP-binding protein